MSGTDPQPIPPVVLAPVTIAYESKPTARSRPWWVFLILAVYLLLVAALLTCPFWLGTSGGALLVATVAVTVVTICGLALLLTPIRAVRRRPITRQSILIPIIASGLLAGGLLLGGGFALAQVFAPATQTPYYVGSPTTGTPSGYTTDHTPADSTIYLVIVGAVAVWIAWSVIFALIARQRDPASVGMRLHRLLIVGSVLELLVAVPSHIIVRRRGDCCGGFVTGTGICLGVAVAIVSFGPTVLLLYHRRCQEIRVPANPRDSTQQAITPQTESPTARE